MHEFPFPIAILNDTLFWSENRLSQQTIIIIIIIIICGPSMVVCFSELVFIIFSVTQVLVVLHSNFVHNALPTLLVLLILL